MPAQIRAVGGADSGEIVHAPQLDLVGEVCAALPGVSPRKCVWRPGRFGRYSRQPKSGGGEVWEVSHRACSAKEALRRFAVNQRFLLVSPKSRGACSPERSPARARRMVLCRGGGRRARDVIISLDLHSHFAWSSQSEDMVRGRSHSWKCDPHMTGHIATTWSEASLICGMPPPKNR